MRGADSTGAGVTLEATEAGLTRHPSDAFDSPSLRAYHYDMSKHVETKERFTAYTANGRKITIVCYQHYEIVHPMSETPSRVDQLQEFKTVDGRKVTTTNGKDFTILDPMGEIRATRRKA